MENITYKNALNKIALMEEYIKTDCNINSFDRSLILSLLFEIDKTKVLDDIFNIRKNKQ